jgi:hypothetical protein
MTRFGRLILGAAMGAGVLAFSGLTASAAIVCSGNECWHTHSMFRYPAEAHVIVHPDGWRWAPHDHFAWREHEGRGYWQGDTWRDF